jgi:hypothetical protein
MAPEDASIALPTIQIFNGVRSFSTTKAAMASRTPGHHAPMTTKQCKKAYNKRVSSGPKLSKEDLRRMERQEQLEQRAQEMREKAKTKRERKKKAEEKERREHETRRRMGTEKVELPKVRASQKRLDGFFGDRQPVEDGERESDGGSAMEGEDMTYEKSDEDSRVDNIAVKDEDKDEKEDEDEFDLDITSSFAKEIEVTMADKEESQQVCMLGRLRLASFRRASLTPSCRMSTKCWWASSLMIWNLNWIFERIGCFLGALVVR